MKIWSPVKVFRSLIRFLVGKNAFMTEFEVKIFDFLRLLYNFEIKFLKIRHNRQISKVFCCWTLKLKVFSKPIDLCSHSRSNQSSLADILRSQLLIFDVYLVFIGLGRLPTIWYAPIFDENPVPLENRIRERQL